MVTLIDKIAPQDRAKAVLAAMLCADCGRQIITIADSLGGYDKARVAVHTGCQGPGVDEATNNLGTMHSRAEPSFSSIHC